VGAVDHDRAHETLLCDEPGGLGDELGTEIRAGDATPEHDMSIGVAPGSHERGFAFCSDAEKSVRVARRDHRVYRSIDDSVSAVLETDRHRQAARDLAMGLALDRARADSTPAEEVRDELRCEGIENLAPTGDSEFIDIHEQPSGDFEAGRNITGAVELTADSGVILDVRRSCRGCWGSIDPSAIRILIAANRRSDVLADRGPLS